MLSLVVFKLSKSQQKIQMNILHWLKNNWTKCLKKNQKNQSWKNPCQQVFSQKKRRKITQKSKKNSNKRKKKLLKRKICGKLKKLKQNQTNQIKREKRRRNAKVWPLEITFNMMMLYELFNYKHRLRFWNGSLS